MKGILEIADIFVVNKADRPGAELFLKNLRMMISPVFKHDRADIPIVSTVASSNEGITELFEKIFANNTTQNAERKKVLVVEKAYQLIQSKRMRDIDKTELARLIPDGDFNLYKFVDQF